jgi:hypothetical protein
MNVKIIKLEKRLEGKEHIGGSYTKGGKREEKRREREK